MNTKYQELLAQGKKNRRLAISLYTKGKTQVFIAHKLGISKQRVNKIIKDWGKK